MLGIVGAVADDARHGMVFIAYGAGQYDAYWDSLPAPPPSRVIEEHEPLPEVAPLVAWGRGRARRVVVRMPDGHHYWAGDDLTPDDVRHWDDTLVDQGRGLVEVIATRPLRLRAHCADCNWVEEFTSDAEAAGATQAHALVRCRA